MKRILLFVMTLAALSLAGCTDKIQPEEHTASKLVVDFVPVQNDVEGTKAIKTGWENGDIVFIFFQDVTADSRYLKMKYEDGSWDIIPMNGLTGADLTPDGSKTLTAVYLPFASSSEPVFTNDCWSFAKSQYYFTYYLYASGVPYQVRTEGDISTISVSGGKIQMYIPDGFVQFFYNDASATDESFFLRVTGMQPSRLESIGADGHLREYSHPMGAAVPGYAYQGGHLFSGKLHPDIAGKAADYTFHLFTTSTIKTATAAQKTLQNTGAAGRAVNVTDLNWSEDGLRAVPMFKSGNNVVYFANMNLGSLAETEPGQYFAWGEIEGFAPNGTSFTNSFAWNNYKWGYDSNGTKMLHKYCSDQANWAGTGSMDNKRKLDSEDDAAAIHFKGAWRMPTRAEMSALVNNCTWSWQTNYNKSGVNGYLVTGKGTYSSNSIFLPAGGQANGNGLTNTTNGYYWGADRNNATTSTQANILLFTSNTQSYATATRVSGLLIRPVRN